MANKTSTVLVRIDPGTKDQAEAILAELGLSASAAINLYYKQIIRSNGIPFDLKLPTDHSDTITT